MAKQNFMDRCIAAVSPVWAVKRAAARTALEFANSGYGNYGANATKKSMRGWMYYGGSAKEDIEDNIDVLRQRSRDAYMGIPIATASLKTLRTNVVAGGLMPSPQIDAEYLKLSEEQAAALQAQILREFYLWADTPVCDADRVDNFYKLQQEVEAAIKRVDAGFSTAEEETAQLTGGDYSRNIRKRVIEAKQKKEVDQINSPPTSGTGQTPPEPGGKKQEGETDNA